MPVLKLVMWTSEIGDVDLDKIIRSVREIGKANST